MCARPPAGRPELWWHGGQVPANRLAAALPAQHVPLFLQPPAGTGPALPVPAERAAGLRTVSRAAIGWQQPQQRPPVLIARRPRRSHAGNLPGDGRQRPITPWHRHHHIGGPASRAHSRRSGRQSPASAQPSCRDRIGQGASMSRCAWSRSRRVPAVRQVARVTGAAMRRPGCGRWLRARSLRRRPGVEHCASRGRSPAEIAGVPSTGLPGPGGGRGRLAGCRGERFRAAKEEHKSSDEQTDVLHGVAAVAEAVPVRPLGLRAPGEIGCPGP